ncbi:MAG: hypothetical protein R2705_13775 [Ilumatobacteraceae bacterium]
MENCRHGQVAALMARVLVDGESAESVHRDRRRLPTPIRFTERHFIRA